MVRIRELLYDEGFTIAGAKKRIEAEISGGVFDGPPGKTVRAKPAVAEKDRRGNRAVSRSDRRSAAVGRAEVKAFRRCREGIEGRPRASRAGPEIVLFDSTGAACSNPPFGRDVAQPG